MPGSRRQVPAPLWVLAVLLLLAPGVARAQRTLTYASFAPATTFPSVQMERWATEVSRRLAGRVRVVTYADGRLLGARSMLDGVRAGQADIGVLCMAYQPGRFPLTTVLCLPLGIGDALTGTRVLQSLCATFPVPALADVEVLALFTSPPASLMTVRPVRRQQDLRGMTIRAAGPATRILRCWGATPVGMPLPEAAKALRNQEVQGLFSSIEVLQDYDLAAVCRFVTVTDTVVYPFAVVMNRSRWNALPADVQRVLRQLRQEHGRWTAAYADRHAAEVLARVEQTAGVQVLRLSSREKQRWNDQLRSQCDGWADMARQRSIPADAVLAHVRSMLAQEVRP